MTKNRQMMKKPQIWEKGQNREKPDFRRKNGLDRVNKPNLVRQLTEILHGRVSQKRPK